MVTVTCWRSDSIATGPEWSSVPSTLIAGINRSVCRSETAEFLVLSGLNAAKLGWSAIGFPPGRERLSADGILVEIAGAHYMPPSHSLVQYRLTLKRHRARGSGEIFQRGGDFDGFGILSAWLRSIKGRRTPLCEKPGDVESATKAIKLVDLTVDEAQGLIYALFEAGEGGREQTVRNIPDGKDVAYIKRKHAAHSPYLVALRFFDNYRSAVALCHTVGGLSIKGPFQTLLDQEAPLASAYKWKLKPEANAKVLEHSLKVGKGTEVIFSNSGKSETSREGRLQKVAGDPVPDSAVFQLAMRKLTSRQVKRMVKNVDKAEKMKTVKSSRKAILLKDAIETDVRGLSVVDEVKVRITMPNGRPRVFNVLTPDSAKISHSIDEDLAPMPSTGNPSFRKLVDAATACFNDATD